MINFEMDPFSLSLVMITVVMRRFIDSLYRSSVSGKNIYSVGKTQFLLDIRRCGFFRLNFTKLFDLHHPFCDTLVFI